MVEYEGIAYYLCCPLCQAQFERAPKTYANPEFGEKVKKTARRLYRKQLS